MAWKRHMSGLDSTSNDSTILSLTSGYEAIFTAPVMLTSKVIIARRFKVNLRILVGGIQRHLTWVIWPPAVRGKWSEDRFWLFDKKQETIMFKKLKQKIEEGVSNSPSKAQSPKPPESPVSNRSFAGLM